MSKLIQHRLPAANTWFIPEDPRSAASRIAAGEDTIVPLAAWEILRELLPASGAPRRARIGVLLEPSDAPTDITADLHRLDLIAVRFPVFTDGRGYSTGRLLRERHGWAGPLMACGDVLRDQLLLLERCGFDTFWLRDDQDLAASLRAFADFSEFYQSSVERAPLFARRIAAESAS